MDALALFGISVAFSFAAWGVVTARYLCPSSGYFRGNRRLVHSSRSTRSALLVSHSLCLG